MSSETDLTIVFNAETRNNDPQGFKNNTNKNRPK